MDEKRNEQFMKLVRRVHNLISSDDFEQSRASQELVGKKFGTDKELFYEEEMIKGICTEWIRTSGEHKSDKIILYCHGGGYSTGSVLYARAITNKLADFTKRDVYCFDYRLAPEQPYPAALEDVYTIWTSLLEEGYKENEILVCGDSAGGNLAIELGIMLKKQGKKMPEGFILFSPWTDMTMSGKSYEIKKELDPVLDKEYIDRARKAYIGESDIAYEDDSVSPVYADFTGFPPVYIQVGSNEILLSDSVLLSNKLLRAEVPVKIDVFKGMWHVFQMGNFKTAYEAMNLVVSFICENCQ